MFVCIGVEEFKYMCCYKIPLTHYGQLEAQADLWLGRHLALVRGRVARLPGGDAQRPLVRALGVHRLEALIVRVGHDADGDDVQVMLADPRDLRPVCESKSKRPQIPNQSITETNSLAHRHPNTQQRARCNIIRPIGQCCVFEFAFKPANHIDI